MDKLELDQTVDAYKLGLKIIDIVGEVSQLSLECLALIVFELLLVDLVG